MGIQREHSMQAGGDGASLQSVIDMIGDLLGRRLPNLERKIDELRELLAARQKERLTVEEFADLVGRSPYTVRRWVATRKIEATRIEGTGPRGRLLIARSEVNRVIADGFGASIPGSAVDPDEAAMPDEAATPDLE